jgi:hypothetical protein
VRRFTRRVRHTVPNGSVHTKESATLTALHPREASIFACLTETVVQPAAPLPPVSGTDAVVSFDRWMARCPRPNRVGIRVLLYAVEAGPLLAGFGRRLRRLAPAERTRYVQRVEHSRLPQIRQIAKLVKGMSFVSYYGDDAIMRALGYDPEANLARGRALRAAEGRP